MRERLTPFHFRPHFLRALRKGLKRTRWIACSQHRLDGAARFYRSLELQKQIFAHILKSCAQAGGRVVSVHSFRAVKTVLDLTEAALPDRPGQIVLHWFTGSRSDARRASELGCYFSINVQMLKTERGQDLVADLPFDRILTETDGPFTNVGGRPAFPADVATTVTAVANLRRVTAADLTEVIHGNLRTLLGEGGS